MTRLPDVIFVCVHNAGRSQIARAIFNRSARDAGLDLAADSAGTLPSDHVHPEVQSAMLELNLDLSGEHGKLLTDPMLAHGPRIITMGCSVDAQACPSLVLEDVEDWELPDPAGRPLEEVRKIRDEIDRRVRLLLSELASS